ncbi:hypothetical protein PENTCL1PPCAC_27971, partial [Pristionchus entomophagus]
QTSFQYVEGSILQRFSLIDVLLQSVHSFPVEHGLLRDRAIADPVRVADSLENLIVSEADCASPFKIEKSLDLSLRHFSAVRLPVELFEKTIIFLDDFIDFDIALGRLFLSICPQYRAEGANPFPDDNDVLLVRFSILSGLLEVCGFPGPRFLRWRSCQILQQMCSFGMSARLRLSYSDSCRRCSGCDSRRPRGRVQTTGGGFSDVSSISDGSTTRRAGGSSSPTLAIHYGVL